MTLERDPDRYAAMLAGQWAGRAPDVSAQA